MPERLGTPAVRAPASASIIINNYNYARFLRDCIDSAIEQTHSAQVIVVDDGSTDNSVEIMRSYGSRVVPVFKTNGGQGSAVNAGFALATGDIVIILDSDDMLEPNAVSELLRQWRPGTVMAHYAMTIVDGRGTPIGIHPDPPECLDQGDVVPVLLQTGRFRSTVTSGMAFLRSALLDCMPIAESQFREAVDGYLMRCVVFLGSVQRINGRLARYRSHGGNLSNVAIEPDGMARSCRSRIAVRRNEFAIVREQSAKHNQPNPSNCMGDDDPYYLALRLFSLILAPDKHPIANDQRLELLRKYIHACIRGPEAWQSRALGIALALAASLTPRRQATRFITWHCDPRQRPTFLRALAWSLRPARRRSLRSEAGSSGVR